MSSAPNLPLLHKYVFHRDDDLQLRMSKLQYRLCVQEVSSVILGHKVHDIHYNDIEETIEPDFTMATTVESAPPRLEDYPPDEGLSSPDSEDFPHKPQDTEYMYNDSGIILDDSVTTPQATETETNRDVDDSSSDISDPSDYHIPRPTEPTTESHSSHNMDDSAIIINGDMLDNSAVSEDTIEAISSSPREADISFDHLQKPTEEELQEISESSLEVPTETQRQSPEPPSVVVTEPEDEEEEEEIEEVMEEVIEKTQVKQEEEVQPEEPEEKVEVEKVDFVPGTLTCEDVDTALQILKTHYRLSCSSLKKCIITSPDNRNKRYSAPVFSPVRSKWNLQDVVRTPHDDAPWWTGIADSDVPEQENLPFLTDTINRKEDEISKLLQKVLDEEKKKNEEEERRKAPPEEEIIVLKEEPVNEGAPPIEKDGTDGKKKKGNIFQRMMRALRKRMSGNRHRA